VHRPEPYSPKCPEGAFSNFIATTILHKIASSAQIGQVFQLRHLSPSTKCWSNE
jgi:hypothetical protein